MWSLAWNFRAEVYGEWTICVFRQLYCGSRNTFFACNFHSKKLFLHRLSSGWWIYTWGMQFLPLRLRKAPGEWIQWEAVIIDGCGSAPVRWVFPVITGLGRARLNAPVKIARSHFLVIHDFLGKTSRFSLLGYFHKADKLFDISRWCATLIFATSKRNPKSGQNTWRRCLCAKQWFWEETGLTSLVYDTSFYTSRP